MSEINFLIKKIISQKNFNIKEIIFLLKFFNTKQKRSILTGYANEIRQQYVGNRIHLRAIIEFSNYCKQDCFYCGLRKSNLKLIRYRMSSDEIFSVAEKIKSFGIKTIILQSGEDSFYTLDKLLFLINKIKIILNLTITLSIGEKSFDDLLKLKNAGAEKYLLKYESSSSQLYSNFHPRLCLKHRIKCIQWLQYLKYKVGTGFIVGLPNQNFYHIANDILLLISIKPNMVAIGPFIANLNTPLAFFLNGNLNLTFTIIAIVRLLMKSVYIPATAALDILNKQGRKIALLAGSNVLMINFTPDYYRLLYELYPRKNILFNPQEIIEKIQTFLPERNIY